MGDITAGKSLIPSTLSRRDEKALADYSLRRKASALEAIRLRIRASELVTFVENVALEGKKMGKQTGLRLRAAEILLRKVLPDVQQIEYRGLLQFAPLSSRQAALANLSDEQLDAAIKIAEMIKAAEPEAIEGTSERVPEETA